MGNKAHHRTGSGWWRRLEGRMSDTEQELKPGRKLDRLVAEKTGLRIYNSDTDLGVDINGKYLTDWNKNYPHFTKHVPTQWNPVPLIYWQKKGWDGISWLPSKDIKIAWVLVELATKDESTVFTLTKCRNSKLWEAEFDGYKEYQASTPAHAICKAFLALPDLGEIR
jgi:hypothetical protein